MSAAPLLAVSDVLEYELGALAFEEKVAANRTGDLQLCCGGELSVGQEGPPNVLPGVEGCADEAIRGTPRSGATSPRPVE